ncbi:MAG: nucleotidyltransferase domain-containing protein [Kiritimatiellae bacterium]|nr:nucleotidyltransferase domain-containing protein [Kiritimatiellia bacterium]
MLEKVVGSQGRAAIFKMLFTEQHRKAHLREIARITGLSAPSLMRELRELARLGVVCQEKDGNRVDYSANTSSPLYEPICVLVRKTEGGERLLAQALSDCDAEVAFIYGSRAKGTARADSDYDVFIIGNEGLRHIVARFRSVAEEIDVEVNPYVLSRKEFVGRLKAGDHFLSEVVSSPKVFLKGTQDELAAMAS